MLCFIKLLSNHSFSCECCCIYFNFIDGLIDWFCYCIFSKFNSIQNNIQKYIMQYVGTSHENMSTNESIFSAVKWDFPFQSKTYFLICTQVIPCLSCYKSNVPLSYLLTQQYECILIVEETEQTVEATFINETYIVCGAKEVLKGPVNYTWVTIKS